MTYDCFVYLHDIAPGRFFYESVNTMPAEYVSLSREIEKFCAARLVGPRPKLTFRLFIFGHSHHDGLNEDAKPMFSTTCSVQVHHRKRSATVLQRSIDEDFAMCPLNGGCERCHTVESESEMEYVEGMGSDADHGK
jgi:hypothetical protein